MSRTACALAAAAMMLSSTAFAQTGYSATGAANPTGNPTLNDNKNTPNAARDGVPATLSNDTPTGSNVPGGGSATGGPSGGSKSGGGGN